MSVQSDTPVVQPFDPRSKCPKCDAGEAQTVWRPGTVAISRILGLVAHREREAEPGWMHRTCTQCGYDWAESTLDGE